MTTYQQTFDFWGQRLTIKCSDAVWLQNITDYISLATVSGAGTSDNTLTFQVAPASEAEQLLPLPEERYKVFSSCWDEPPVYSRLDIYVHDEMRYGDWSGFGRYRVDTARGQVSAVAYSDCTMPSAYQLVFLAESPLRRLMPDAFFVHAGCLSVNGQGILLCGPSGAGKSTATFALLQAGIPTLTDEAAFIRKTPGGYEAQSLGRVVKVRQNAIQKFFPNLANRPARFEGAGEYYYPIDSLPNGTGINRTDLRAVIAVRQSHVRDSRLERVSPLQVVNAVFPVTLFELDEERRTAKFHKLVDMLNDVECYQLHFGTDMDNFAACMQAWAAVSR